ncbi:MAG: DEAD/DEAH box helicase [Deltaproteobacteria bacterium]|nr:DEAD/DEAH box helicase [Deltaproteobacteria bacterium]
MTQLASFSDLALDPRLLAAISRLGFDEPTPIQAEALPPLLEGRDLIGGARTGSGKTAAFGLSLLERVKDGGDHVRALVLAPTRELAVQVTRALESFAEDLPQVRMTTIYGGVSIVEQLRQLHRGVHVVVGTPGRVLDHLGRGTLDLSKVEMVVLDEADEMLRMGFIEDVESILNQTPEGRQVALFSATMPDQIRKIASSYLKDPVEARVEEKTLTVDHIEQRWLRVPERYKVDALVRVLAGESWGTTLVFARTRASCAEVADALAQRGFAVDALHGDLAQSSRELVLKRLRSGGLKLVVATDVAARGIDVEHITHVINYNLPDETESYVHRIGRTGRAGRVGKAISLVTPKERRQLRDIQTQLKVNIVSMTVPSDAALAKARRERMEAGMLAAEPGAAVKEWFDRLVEQGMTPEQISLALLNRLAEEADLHLDGGLDEEVPAWARPAENLPPLPREQTNQTELFFPIGRNRRVRPGDVVGALAHEAGVASPMIGRVTILDNKTFVGLPEDVAAQVVASFESLELRGVRVPVALARQHEGGVEARGRGGRDRRGGFDDRRGGRGYDDRGGRGYDDRGGPGYDDRGGYEDRGARPQGRDARPDAGGYEGRGGPPQRGSYEGRGGRGGYDDRGRGGNRGYEDRGGPPQRGAGRDERRGPPQRGEGAAERPEGQQDLQPRDTRRDGPPRHASGGYSGVRGPRPTGGFKKPRRQR